MASNNVASLQSVLDRVLDKLKNQRDCYLSDYNKQILAGH